MKSLLLGLSKLFSVRMLAIILTLLQTIVITRLYGSELFGLLSFSLSVSAILLLLFSFGLDQVLSRDVAIHTINEVHKEIRWRKTWELVFYFVLPFVLIFSVAGAYISLKTNFFGSYSYALFFVFVTMPLLVGRKYAESLNLGCKNVVKSILGSQVVFPFSLIIFSLFFFFSKIELSVQIIFFNYSAAVLVSVCASVYFLKDVLKSLSQSSKESTVNGSELICASKGIVKSGISFSLISMGFVLSQHADVLIMGIYSTPENVALVRIASRIAEIAGLMRVIIVLQYRPLVSEAFGKNDLVKIKSYSKYMLNIFILTGLPIVTFILFFAEEILLVFGNEFTSAGDALRVYAVAVLLTLLAGPGDVILAQTKYESIVSRILFLSLFIQISLNVILIPFFNVIGCAIANLCALVFTSCYMRYEAKKKLGIEPSILLFFMK